MPKFNLVQFFNTVKKENILPEARVLQIVPMLEIKTVDTPTIDEVITGLANTLRATLPVFVEPKPPDLALSTIRPNPGGGQF